MTRSINTIGLRLAGPVVRGADGRVVTIPWEFVAGSSTRMRTAEAARLLHPGAPERLVGLRGVGTVTVRGLRARALSRAMREGTHQHVWRISRVRDFALLIGMILFIAVFGFAAQLGLARWLMEDDPSDWPPIRDIDQNSRILAGIAAAVGVAGPLLIVILGRFRRRATAVALKTSAAGITWFVDDGREVIQPWTDAPVPLARDGIWPKPPRGIRFSGAVVEKHDFEILRLVFRGRGVIVRKGSRARRVKRTIKAMLWMNVAFGILLGLHLLVRVLLPNPVETPYSRPPPLSESTIVAAAVWGLYTAVFGGAVVRAFGWRAVRRAFAKPAKRGSLPRKLG